MNYPLISEYIEAIKSAEDNFEELSYLRPVLGDDGLPVMTSGNFAVVFKMKDVQSGKLYAVKCFTKEQEGRSEAYNEITKELKKVYSPYLISIRYLEKELFVDTEQATETEFPVLLMDWVEGKPLDKYLRENLESKYLIETLLVNFYQLAEWLITQSFAHGDLKPENILVCEDCTLILVDYDGMYVPAMKGQKSREIGSPDFCHPQRSKELFNEHIDDFSILTVLLSLCIVFVNKNYLAKYGAEDRLLFSKNDYIDIRKSLVFNDIPPVIEKSINYKSLFEQACEDLHFHLGKGMLTPVIMLISARSKESNDAIKELAHLGGVLEKTKINKTDIGTFPNRHTEPLAASNTNSHGDSIDQNDKKSTEWQAALLLHALITLIAYWIYYSNPETISWDRKWDYVGWGFFLGGIVWFFFFFDYIKRDGSFGNCLIACFLYPITLYYVLYRCVVSLINIFKR